MALFRQRCPLLLIPLLFLFLHQCRMNCKADPYELTNLIGLESHAETSAVLRDRLVLRMIEAGEAAPTIAAAPHRPSGGRHVSAAEAHA